MPTDEGSKPANCPPILRSSAHQFDKEIKAGIENDLTVQRIYQDLRTGHNAEIRNNAVKRYVRKLKKHNLSVYPRLHCPPGKEAQHVYALKERLEWGQKASEQYRKYGHKRGIGRYGKKE